MCLTVLSAPAHRARPSCSENLRADEGAEYDQVIEINLSELEPQVGAGVWQQCFPSPLAGQASAPD